MLFCGSMENIIEREYFLYGRMIEKLVLFWEIHSQDSELKFSLTQFRVKISEYKKKRRTRERLFLLKERSLISTECTQITSYTVIVFKKKKLSRIYKFVNITFVQPMNKNMNKLI